MAQRSTERNQMSKKKCSKCSHKCSSSSPESISLVEKLASKFKTMFRKIDNIANPPSAPQNELKE